ncbi:MAG: ferritin family protein [Phycisphaerae bacterium]
MHDDFEAKVRSLSLPKALALASYGESVAAYRYRTLVEKTDAANRRNIFRDMADEEQGHHAAVLGLIRKHCPGSDFVLSPDDKALVIVGPRTLDLSDPASVDRAMELIWGSERQTGRFYAIFRDITDDAELKAWFKTMADECFEHAALLRNLPLDA